MADIRTFIKSHLLEPLKYHPTVIQDTLIELITQRLQELYDYSAKFPEILEPNQSRLDILQAIAQQFLFTVREDADIQEQLDILTNILYSYNKRGSIDTIENMWKYYGGTLPKDVKVIIPSYNLFRYSISKLSGTHVFQDGMTNRTGVYEIRLTNNTYPIPDLRDFLIKELVAAGNYFYFTNTLHMDVIGDYEATNPYKYLVYKNTVQYIQLDVLKAHQGLTWSGYNGLSLKGEDHAWSGRGSIFLELTHIKEIGNVKMNTYLPYESDLVVVIIKSLGDIMYKMLPRLSRELQINSFLYCTPSESAIPIARHLYDRQGNPVDSPYSGYFILGHTMLGEVVS